ncbi:hypothetical protein H4R19_003731, partial [Coemansia spiralis]
DAGMAQTPPHLPPPLVLASSSQQRLGPARAGGLLNIFRRGPPKHPKLNPVGISSKDFFAREPVSAPLPASGLASAPVGRGAKLTRRLSAVSPAPPRAASPQSMTPMTATATIFSVAASECFSDSDVPQARASGLAQSAAWASGDEASGDRKRRGSLWRAKLGFTNTRRPESRQQRYQSFDCNAVDIAAHPRMFPESPLVSLPTAAPATAHSRTSNQRLADTLLEAGIDIAARHSTAPSTPGHQHGLAAGSPEDVGGLATIDRDFLLTIQRNSALEARRQRRRETRRSTMSVLAATGGEGSAAWDHHAVGSPPGIGHQFAPASACGTAVCPAPTAPRAAGDGPEPPCAVATASPPKKPRPTSLDFAAGVGAHAAGSSGSARSSRDGARPHRLGPSEIGQAMAKETVAQAALASSAARPAPGVVPPVPPLPNHIAARSPQPTAQPERPATARARGSQRQVTDSRRHRGSASAVPSALHLPPPLDAAGPSAQPLGDLGARLREYSMSSASGGLGVALEPSALHVGGECHAASGGSDAARKHSQPEVQPRPQHAPGALPSPMPSPGRFSKSAASLGARISFDNSRFKTRDIGASTTLPHRHGLSRLFSPSPPSRKSQQPPLPRRPQKLDLDWAALGAEDPDAPLPPTSPAVASLVGDPSARRKIRDQLASSMAFDRLLEEDDEFVMAISLTPTVAGTPLATPGHK